MRRANAISVKVKAPSAGLVTRWPGDIADFWNTNVTDLYRNNAQRVCAAAQNVRFEDGVIKNAPGYEQVQVITSLLANCVAHWTMDEVNGTRYDLAGDHDLTDVPGNKGQSYGNAVIDVSQVSGKLGMAAFFPATPPTGFQPYTSAPSLVNTDSALWQVANGSFTVSGWFNFGGLSNSTDLIIAPGFILTQSGNQISVSVFRVGLTTGWVSHTFTPTLTANTWTFLTFIFNTSGTLATLYVNSSTDTFNVTENLAATGGTQQFAFGDNSVGRQNVAIDSVTVWGRALSGTEVSFVYNSGSGREYPFIGSAATLLHEANLITAPNNPLLMATGTDIYSVQKGFSSNPRAFTATLTDLFTGSPTTAGYFWSAADFFDKVLLAQHDNFPQYWVNGASSTNILPGLALNENQFSGTPDGSANFDGVTSFFGHVILWNDDIIKWSDLNDFTNYIPVGSTATSATLTIKSPGFTQPAIGSTVVVATVEDPYGNGTTVTVGQFVRINDMQGGLPYYNFYTITAAQETGTSLASAVIHSGAGGTGYIVNDILTINSGFGTVAQGGTAAQLKVTGVSGGAITTVSVQTAGNYKVLPGTLTAIAVTGGTGSGATFDLTFNSTGNISNQVTLQLLGTTGSTPASDTIGAGEFIQTLDANEAGEQQNAGNLVNGPIYQIIPMGDYAYVFKEWSIQSMQYVGSGSGIFYIRTEVTREGPVGRNAVKNLGNGNIVFLGHRELYSYTGGAQPTPICQQYTRQLFAELDRTQLDEVIIHHREPRNEVWVVYPVTGGQKVLIWNYMENSATLDIYDAPIASLTALEPVTWSIDPSWESEPLSLTWGTFSQTTDWAELTDTGDVESSLIATSTGTLLMHGQVYSRLGDGYVALAETMDYDFGDNTVFKYIDVVHVGFNVVANASITSNVYIQVGTRTTLDEDIKWSASYPVNVQGNANFTAKVNPGGSGRYVRLRFYSQDANIQWAVTSFEIYARAGGTY